MGSTHRDLEKVKNPEDTTHRDLEKVKNPEDTTHWDLKSKSRRAISTGICLFKMPVGKYPPAFASFQNPGGHYPLAASLMHLQHCLQNDLQCRFKSPCTTPSPSAFHSASSGAFHSAFHSASSGAFCHLALSKRLY